MLTATLDKVTTYYQYDGEGRRVRKSIVDGNTGKVTTTRFVYGPSGLLDEYEGDTVTLSAPTREYVYGPTGLLAIVEGGGIKYLTPDHLGTPRVVTDGTGKVVSRHDYYPFGEEIGAGIGGRTDGMGFSVDDKVRQKFTGYERDNETGLDFAQARYYGSAMGRFVSADPLDDSGDITNPQTWNRYTYSLNNPQVLIDPDGLLTTQPDPPKEIFVFIPLKRRELRLNVPKAGGVPAFTIPPPDYERLSNDQYKIHVLRRGKATLKAFNMARKRGDVAAILILTHAIRYTYHGQSYRVLRFAGGAKLRTPVDVEAPLICLLGCNTKEAAGYINPLGTSIIAVDSGPDEKTNLGTLAQVASAIIETIIAQGSLGEAIQAGDSAFAPATELTVGNQKNPVTLSRSSVDQGDRLVLYRGSGFGAKKVASGPTKP